MEASFFSLRDGARLRLARWQPGRAPSRGTVLLLTGRSEAVEKYQEMADDLGARGFAVQSLDWRGQGLSDRLLPQRQRGHLDDFGTLVADLAEVIDRAVAPSLDGRPLILLGHSMGGMVALRYLAECPGTVRLAAFTAPMVAILAVRRSAGLLARLARLMVARGQGDRYVPGHGDYNPTAHTYPGNWLTSDAARFEVQKRVYDSCPDLRLGGITWGWLDAACRSTAILLKPDYASRINVPVLIASAGKERLVDNAAQRRLAEQLPDCTFKRYPGALHEILMERNAIRGAFLADFDIFLDQHGI